MQAKHDLFISYHTPDRDAVTSVRQVLKARGISSFIDREHLVAGLPWPQALEQSLKGVSAVAVFLGPRGLGLWQKREIGFALDRQVQEERDGRVFPVIPVLLPGADPVSGFLFLNTWVDLREDVGDSSGLEALARAISGELIEPLTETREVILPYRGLEVFHEEHAAFFCGRETFSERLLNTTLSRNLIAVVGPSGSGKSSVVQAGLIPALRRQLPPAETWDAVVFTPGDRPYHRLAAALIPLLESDLSETSRLMEAEALGTALADGNVRLEGAVNRLLEKSKGTDRLLLVADQFEELFTTVPEADRKPFITSLMETRSSSPVSLLLTLRADFYGNALSLSRALSDALENGVVNLGPMRREELERAISVPAERVGLVFEAGLGNRILDDVAEQPGYLPLLEFALTELWARREDRQLTHSSYEAIGGVVGALTQRAETEFAKLTDEQQKTARRVFTHLVRVARPEEGNEDTRKRTTLAELGEAARAVVKELARARLLVTSSEESGEAKLHGLAEADGERSFEEADVDFSARNTVEVAHESLIRGWDRLRGWLDEDRELLLWQQRLGLGAAEWERTGHDAGTLLRGGPLAEAERWLGARGEDLSSDECAFIRASTRTRKRRKWVQGVVAAVIFLILALISAWQYRELEVERAKSLPIEPDMAIIKPGRFTMRSLEGLKHERPPHEVVIKKRFAIGRFEVTFEEFDKFAYDTGRRPANDAGWGGVNRPVINVSWEDAKAYANWLSERTGKRYRLPTEAEWEYAARAGTETAYSFGDDDSKLGEYAWYFANSERSTHPVGQKKPNAWGLYDMHGNVWEWVEDDYHESYEGAPDDGSAWVDKPRGTIRVMRGGSWSGVARDCRSANRSFYWPVSRDDDLGFRLARSLILGS
jgi:formylglycine-generating enzyme required for sulfatase activity